MKLLVLIMFGSATIRTLIPFMTESIWKDWISLISQSLLTIPTIIAYIYLMWLFIK